MLSYSPDHDGDEKVNPDNISVCHQKRSLFWCDFVAQIREKCNVFNKVPQGLLCL